MQNHENSGTLCGWGVLRQRQNIDRPKQYRDCYTESRALGYAALWEVRWKSGGAEISICECRLWLYYKSTTDFIRYEPYFEYMKLVFCFPYSSIYSFDKSDMSKSICLLRAPTVGRSGITWSDVEACNSFYARMGNHIRYIWEELTGWYSRSYT